MDLVLSLSFGSGAEKRRFFFVIIREMGNEKIMKKDWSKDQSYCERRAVRL